MSTIAELFAKDPLEQSLTEEELSLIIEHYRKQRVNFTKANARTDNVKQTKKVLAGQEMQKDLGIDKLKLEI